MTISYSYDIASSKYFTFLKIIWRWRGSIWKSVAWELVVWTISYYVVYFVYEEILSDDLQDTFKKFAKYCSKRLDHSKLKYIPLEFLLGFFVKTVVDRWSKIFSSIGLVDNPAHFIGAYVRGNDPETRTMRRNIARYLCLTQVFVLRDICIPVRKRFPNMDSIVDAGFMLPHEKDLIEGHGKNSEEFAKYWMPMNWVFAGCYRLRASGKIVADTLLDGMFAELRAYRSKLQSLCDYDWVPIPLAYTQTVFLAVRVYFFLCIFTRQPFIKEVGEDHKEKDEPTIYFPFMTLLQLIFYLGWLKVAEALINPLGEDDDDFECNFIIDRNIAIALAIADECYDEMPEQKPDNFPDGEDPMYSEEALDLPQHPLIGSAVKQNPDQTSRVTMVRRPTRMSTQRPNYQENLSSPRLSNVESVKRRITAPIVKLRESFKRFKRKHGLTEENDAHVSNQQMHSMPVTIVEINNAEDNRRKNEEDDKQIGSREGTFSKQTQQQKLSLIDEEKDQQEGSFHGKR